MDINITIKPSFFNDKYYPYAYDYSHRYEVYYGGAGSGKSIFVFQKIVIKALREKRKVLVIRKVAKTNLNSTFQTTIDTLSRMKILQYCKVNYSTQKITLYNGSVFLFYGMDDPEKIKSITGITDIVCEECTELDQEDADQLDLRLRAKKDNLQMFFMFNPVSKANWVYKKWFADGVVVDDDTFILRSTYHDNRFLPQSYVDSIEKLAKTNPAYYKIYALGQFCSLDKLVFNNYTVKEFNYTEIDGALAIGIDFGFTNDPCTIVSSIIDEQNKQIYIFEAWGKTGVTNQQLAKIIEEKGYAKSVIIADAAEPKSIEEIKQAGIRRIKACVKGQDSINYGIQKLQQYEIFVLPKCEKIIEEFENYSWQKDKTTGEYINKPIDAWNHYIDALRYSLQCLKDGKLKSMSKAALGL